MAPFLSTRQICIFIKLRYTVRKAKHAQPPTHSSQGLCGRQRSSTTHECCCAPAASTLQRQPALWSNRSLPPLLLCCTLTCCHCRLATWPTPLWRRSSRRQPAPWSPACSGSLLPRQLPGLLLQARQRLLEPQPASQQPQVILSCLRGALGAAALKIHASHTWHETWWKVRSWITHAVPGLQQPLLRLRVGRVLGT